MRSEKYNILREETILSQYSTSPNILRLTESFADVMDPTDDIDLFYDKVFNITTAEGWGLDNWGRILALPRGVVASSDDWFGYYQSNLKPFDQAPFYNQNLDTKIFELTDTAYRTLLKFKALANISACSVDEGNRQLKEIFPAFVGTIDNGDMTVTLIYQDWVSSYDLAIINQYHSIFLPAGVGIKIQSVNPAETFGFRGSGLETFGTGSFTKYARPIIVND